MKSHIKYTDGAEIEARILSLVKERTDLSSNTAIAQEHYAESWPVKYHLCPERANLLRHLRFDGLDVLELGAGMGAISRYLAENSKSLTVVEGTQSRYAVLEARLRDLHNWNGIIGNIQDVVLPIKYDVVCIIGVLEYAELYVTPPPDFDGSPFLWFLNKASEHLKEGGVLILAIENKLGLKYWSGAAEDHTNRLFEGICGYTSTKSTPRTFSRNELTALLHTAGLSAIEEYFPFPDYKLPKAVLSQSFTKLSPRLAAGLATVEPYRNYGNARTVYFPEALAAASLSDAGLLPDLSNSFLCVASTNAESSIYQKLLNRDTTDVEVAWYYSNYRNIPTQTVFLAAGARPGIRVRKSALRTCDEATPIREGATMRVKWHGLADSAVAEGLENRLKFIALAYFDGAESSYTFLRDFIRWSFGKWALESTENADYLNGFALDGTIMNGCQSVHDPSDFELFDLEWELLRPMRKSWFILRNVAHWSVDYQLLQSAPCFQTRGRLYLTLCRDLGIAPDLDADIELEAEFQNLVSGFASVKDYTEKLSRILNAKLPSGKFPRRPSTEEFYVRALMESRSIRALMRMRSAAKSLLVKVRSTFSSKTAT